MTPLAAALAYARAGFPVFPARATADKAQGSKAPHLPAASSPGAKDGGHWLASSDEGKIREWWGRWPDALIGFPTGLRTGTVVVDLDPRETLIDAMVEALARFCGGLGWIDRTTGEVIAPAVAQTQSGGLHFYFAYPNAEWLEIWAARCEAVKRPFEGIFPNRNGLFSAFLKHGECDPALNHVDVRGEGGYVIAPPSVMSSGNVYRWRRKPARALDGGWLLPPLPERLAGVLTRALLPRGEVLALREAAKRSAKFDGRGITDRRVAAYAQACIDGALRRSREAQPGGRNEAVFNAAVQLSRFVRAGHLSASAAEGLLLGNLPAGVAATERKILTTIKNGLAATNVPEFNPAELGPDRRAA